jgi:general secretion pathway protein L
VGRALDDLTKRLPDDTFVIQFEFDGNTLQVQGESASSAKLIEILEDSPLFKDVGFKSPLVKIQGTANDRFHLAATLEATERQLADAEPKESRPAAERVMPPPPPSASQPPPLPTSAGAAPPAPATAATVATGTAAATPAARAAAGKAPTTNAAGGKQ